MTYKYKNAPLDDEKTRLLQKLDQDGTLSKLYEFGVITHKPKIIIESRLKVASMMQTGVSKAKACKLVASYLGVHKLTVYGYLRK